MNAIERAQLSLEGLSVGDGFGERLMSSASRTSALRDRVLLKGPWKWTDDTAMALSIVDELAAGHGIDPAALGRRFARRWSGEPMRGYGSGAHRVLAAIATGEPYALAARLGQQGVQEREIELALARLNLLPGDRNFHGIGMQLRHCRPNFGQH